MFVLQAHPAGGTVLGPLGPPSLQDNPHGKRKEGTLSPAMLQVPFVILVDSIRVCIGSWAQL